MRTFTMGIPSFMRRLMPTEQENTLRWGNTFRLHRHRFVPVKWDEANGPAHEYDPIPEHIDMFDPPRMTDRALYRCKRGECDAEKVVTRVSMM